MARETFLGNGQALAYVRLHHILFEPEPDSHLGTAGRPNLMLSLEHAQVEREEEDFGGNKNNGSHA